MKKPSGRGLEDFFGCCWRDFWWVVTGSNRRHSACKADALPTELTTRTVFLSDDKIYGIMILSDLTSNA